MSKKKEKSYRKIYKDILNGYSTFSLKGERVYIKHFSEVDLGEIEEKWDDYYLEAKSQRLPSEEEKLKVLGEQNLWSAESELEIIKTKREISDTDRTIKKLFIRSQVKGVQEEREKLKKKLDILEKEREDLLGLTCEKYADKKNQIEYLRNALFKDKDYKFKLLTEDEFDEAPEDRLWTLIIIQNSALANFSSEMLKTLAASPFFLNSLMISKGNPFTFYGKPICELSNYQIELFLVGLRYKSIIESGESPPESLYEDMKDVALWYESKLSSGGKSGGKKSKNMSGQTLMGANKEEINSNLDGNRKDTVDLLSEAKKTGKGNLDFQDLLKIHGET